MGVSIVDYSNYMGKIMVYIVINDLFIWIHDNNLGYGVISRIF